MADIKNVSRAQRQTLVKILKIIGIAALITAAIFLVRSRGNSQTTTTNKTQTSQPSQTLEGPFATTQVEQSFPIPVNDPDTGELITTLQYEVLSAEKRNEILVKGQKASAVPGRDFLLVNLKITNSSEQGVKVNTRNYLRLAVGGNQEEWLAPDIHNDPVEVQAISTKQTRVGFPIDEGIDQMTLQFGQIGGDKELIELNF